MLRKIPPFSDSGIDSSLFETMDFEAGKRVSERITEVAREKKIYSHGIIIPDVAPLRKPGLSRCSEQI